MILIIQKSVILMIRTQRTSFPYIQLQESCCTFPCIQKVTLVLFSKEYFTKDVFSSTFVANRLEWKTRFYIRLLQTTICMAYINTVGCIIGRHFVVPMKETSA